MLAKRNRIACWKEVGSNIIWWIGELEKGELLLVKDKQIKDKRKGDAERGKARAENPQGSVFPKEAKQYADAAVPRLTAMDIFLHSSSSTSAPFTHVGFQFPSSASSV